MIDSDSAIGLSEHSGKGLEINDLGMSVWVSKYAMFCSVAGQVVDFAGSVRKFGGSGDRGLERVFFG